MKLKMGMMGLLAALFFAGVASADTLRVVVVQTTDAAAYVKALQDGAAILKSKGSVGKIRAWQATFAGDETGTVVVSVEYPNFDALAKDTALFRSDADLKAWLQSLGKLRKILSDSIYEELK